VITVRYAEAPDLESVRQQLDHFRSSKFGPSAVLAAILHQVVVEYRPVLHALRGEVDGVEDQLMDGEPRALARICQLLRDAVRLERATTPLPAMVDFLCAGLTSADRDLQRYLGVVADEARYVVDRAAGLRPLLTNLSALTRAGACVQRQTSTAPWQLP
jgi:magnesium transporter